MALFVPKHRDLRSAHVISHSIYGLLVLTALLITVEGHVNDPSQIAWTLFGSMFVIGLAEIYSNIVGYRLEHKKDISKRKLKEKIADGMIVVSSSIIPVIIFLLSSFHLFSLETAFNITKGFAVFVLFSYGVIFSRYTKRSWLASLGIGTLDALLGILIILFKASIK